MIGNDFCVFVWPFKYYQLCYHIIMIINTKLMVKLCEFVRYWPSSSPGTANATHRLLHSALKLQVVFTHCCYPLYPRATHMISRVRFSAVVINIYECDSTSFYTHLTLKEPYP